MTVAKGEQGGPPLTGVNILDFSWVVAGPQATKLLGNMGATVLKVEHTGRPDITRHYPPFPKSGPGINRSGTFAIYNDSKLSMTLNLRHPKAATVMERLLRWADVVVENFTPGTLEALGWPYERMRGIRQEIILIRASLMGQRGPFAHHPGFGIMLQAYGGHSALMRGRDGIPMGSSAPWTDFPEAAFVCLAALAALDHRRRTGRGICFDLSQLEASLFLMIPCIIHWAAQESPWPLRDNRHLTACPHGAYPCRGTDRWCLIGVFTESQWESLKRVMGNPGWAEHERFSTAVSRKRNEAELDGLISRWTRGRDADWIVEALQAEGVPAGLVASAQDLDRDPQLRHRGHYVVMDHSETGPVSHDAPPFRLTGTPHRISSPAPMMGEHTERVCREVLGFQQEELSDLIKEGVLS
jgi:benzylsuccinate CoA-transferase BbsF subunit